jgi:hypothetical protein
MAFSNQITQAINSTASGPHGTCQLYAIVVYLIMTRIFSNTYRRFGGASLGLRAHRYSPTHGPHLCACKPSSSLRAHTRAAAYLCLRAHHCAPTYGAALSAGSSLRA